MLRIRFDRDDLVRVRFALWPLGETTLSAQALLRDDGTSLLGEWRERTRGRLTPAAEPLLRLLPRRRHQLRSAAITIPDSDHATVQEELERLEAAVPGGGPRLPSEVLRAYHAAGIAEEWPRLLRHLDSDLAYRARTVLGRGIGEALAAVLGRTRADVLETIAMRAGCSASELARGLGSGLPAVARHLSVLRGAGLLATNRQGRCWPASTPSSCSTCPASLVIGSPGRADTPALSTPTLEPPAKASSARAIAAAMGSGRYCRRRRTAAGAVRPGWPPRPPAGARRAPAR